VKWNVFVKMMTSVSLQEGTVLLAVSFVETEITISFWEEIFFLVMEMIFSWVIFSLEK
jgi:hypothetical protein